MSVVEANITINVPDQVDPARIIEAIQNLVSSSNGHQTRINVVESNDPLTLSPIRNHKWGREGE